MTSGRPGRLPGQRGPLPPVGAGGGPGGGGLSHRGAGGASLYSTGLLDCSAGGGATLSGRDGAARHGRDREAGSGEERSLAILSLHIKIKMTNNDDPALKSNDGSSASGKNL